MLKRITNLWVFVGGFFVYISIAYGNPSVLPSVIHVKNGDVLVYQEMTTTQYVGGGENLQKTVIEKRETVKKADHGLKYGFPLKVGMAWGEGIDGVGCNQSQHDYCNYVENKKNVTVSAGTFRDCFEIVYITGPDTTTEWYCPGVGIVKSEYEHHGTITTMKSELIRIDQK